jgi:hypothetical protein
MGHSWAIQIGPGVTRGGGLEPPYRRRAPEAPLSPPEEEEEEGKGGWRKKPAAGAPLSAGAGFATESNTHPNKKSHCEVHRINKMINSCLFSGFNALYLFIIQKTKQSNLGVM